MDNNFMREGRSKSTAVVGYTTLRDLSQLKRDKYLRSSLSRLQQFKTTYERPFLQRVYHAHAAKGEEVDEEEAVGPLNHLFEPDFAARSMKLCEQAIFQVQAFAKKSRESHRPKVVFRKFHGWDEHFEEILFHRRGELLRTDVTAYELHHHLGLSGGTVKVRNTYNKLRLFLGELTTFNKRQQELQSRIMQERIGSQLRKLQGKLLTMASTKNASKLQYLEEIGRTHDLMLGSKTKIRNKAENIKWFQQELGRININDFYIKEESGINQIENYFTTHKLRRV